MSQLGQLTSRVVSADRAIFSGSSRRRRGGSISHRRQHVIARAEQDHAKLVGVEAREARSSQDLAQLRDELATRDKEVAAMRADHDQGLSEMHAEMKALRQLAQQMMAALPSTASVAQVKP